MRNLCRLFNACLMKWFSVGAIALLLASAAIDNALAAKRDAAQPSRVAALLTPKNPPLRQVRKKLATPANFYNVPGRGRLWCQVSGCRRPQSPGFVNYCARAFPGKNAAQYPYYQFRSMVRGVTLRCNPPKTGGWVCCWRR